MIEALKKYIDVNTCNTSHFTYTRQRKKTSWMSDEEKKKKKCRNLFVIENGHENDKSNLFFFSFLLLFTFLLSVKICMFVCMCHNHILRKITRVIYWELKRMLYAFQQMALMVTNLFIECYKQIIEIKI